MTRIEIITYAFAAGAAAAKQAASPQPVTSAFSALAELLRTSYPAVDLARVTQRPESQPRRAVLAEDLSDAGADSDPALLDAAHTLIVALLEQEQTTPGIGVDLNEVKAAYLRIRNVQAGDTAVRAQNAEFSGGVDLENLTAGDAAAAGQPTTHLNNVRAGGNITIVYGARVALGLRRRYLTEVQNECNLLPWRIVNPHFSDPDRSANLTLADIYTELDTTELRQVEQEEELRHFMRLIHQAERIPVQQMADEAKRLLIMGDPGSGKSTFVKHLAHALASAGLAAENEAKAQAVPLALEPWAHGLLLPVRIELRQVAAFAAQAQQPTGDAHLLLRYLEELLTSWSLADFWPELRDALNAAEPHLLFLLDGLDEVATAQRQLVVDSVNDLCQRYSRQRYVITCRPYAYVGQPWQLVDFRTVTLAPFSQAQIDRFVANWYNRLAEREQLDAVARRQQLQEALRRADLHELAERPLLLTVMTQLHTFTGQLPDDRGQLYADTVNLLLQRWESRHDQGAPLLQQLAIPGLKMSDVEAALYDVAYRAHAAQAADSEAGATADIDEADLRKWLAAYLQGDWNKAGLFIAFIRERAGLLIRHKTDAYTFPHRTFQEYLAACYLIGSADFPTTAADLVRQDPARWREVFLLAVSRAPLGQALAAVHALCPGQVESPDHQADDAERWRRAFLAGSALLEIGRIQVEQQEVGRELLIRLRQWLAHALRQDQLLSAVERAQAGRTLARLGDPRPEVTTVEAMQFCYVPAGPFTMGSADDDPDAEEREKPQHEVTIPYNYWIARFPVTNAQFDQFVAAGGYDNAAYWPEAAAANLWQDGEVTRWYGVWNEEEKKWDVRQETTQGPHRTIGGLALPNHPRVELTWYEALAFSRWLTGHLHAQGWLADDYQVHLPSEAEWEKAARGGHTLPVGAQRAPRLVPARDLASSHQLMTTAQPNSLPARRFPWGDEYDANRLNAAETDLSTTSAVGGFPGGCSPVGAEEMSGNVFEWTRTLWGDKAEQPDFPYPYQSEDGREQLDAGVGIGRILHGGSWAGEAKWQRSSARGGNGPWGRYDDFGLRCVVVPITR